MSCFALYSFLTDLACPALWHRPLQLPSPVMAPNRRKRKRKVIDDAPTTSPHKKTRLRGDPEIQEGSTGSTPPPRRTRRLRSAAHTQSIADVDVADGSHTNPSNYRAYYTEDGLSADFTTPPNIAVHGQLFRSLALEALQTKLASLNLSLGTAFAQRESITIGLFVNESGGQLNISLFESPSYFDCRGST